MWFRLLSWCPGYLPTCQAHSLCSINSGKLKLQTGGTKSRKQVWGTGQALTLLPWVSPLLIPQCQCPPASHEHCGLQLKFKMEPWVPLSLEPSLGWWLWPGEPGLGVPLWGTVSQWNMSCFPHWLSLSQNTWKIRSLLIFINYICDDHHLRWRYLSRKASQEASLSAPVHAENGRGVHLNRDSSCPWEVTSRYRRQLFFIFYKLVELLSFL